MTVKEQATISQVGADTALPDEAVHRLGADMNKGLTTAEARQRLTQYGYNEVAEHKPQVLRLFAKKFWGISAWMLELMIFLSWYLGKYSDMFVIAALLVVNAVLGFWEERQAQTAVDELKQQLQIQAKVLRDGAWGTVPARELVPGDILRLRTGDFVPADTQLFDGELNVDQSALTGESSDVTKAVGQSVSSGSTVRRGEASGIVAATGPHTYFGRTVELVQIAHPNLQIEEIIARVVKGLFTIVLILSLAGITAAVYRRIPFAEVLPLILVVLLSAVPVALPVMMTVSTALGARSLSREGVLVTRLTSSESASMVDVFCVDKTGTITQNRLSVVAFAPADGFEEATLLKYGLMASQPADKDPIDMAFINASSARGIDMAGVGLLHFIPFSPETRRTEAMVRDGEKEYRVIKGAVSTVVEMCGPDCAPADWIRTANDNFAAQGYKTLALAVAETSGSPRLAGLIALADRPRPDSAHMIAEARALGIGWKMLTGDALPTAVSIAASVGIGGNVILAKDVRELLHENLEKAGRLIEKCDGIAEVFPEDKYLIVRSLQSIGHVVAMTGDGVNDAPALRQADVGIAVSTATDVAKGAASVVLTKEGLTGIVSLVKISRMVHRRIDIWVINKISRTLLKAAFVIGTFLVTGNFFVSAFAMLLLVFMTDFVKISLATDNVRWNPVPDRLEVAPLVKIGTVMGVLMVAESAGLLYGIIRYWNVPANAAVMVTVSFDLLFFLAICSLFVVREQKHLWESRPSRQLASAIGADILLVTALSLHGLPGLPGISVSLLATIVGYCILVSLGNDWVKVVLFQRDSSGPHGVK